MLSHPFYSSDVTSFYRRVILRRNIGTRHSKKFLYFCRPFLTLFLVLTLVLVLFRKTFSDSVTRLFLQSFLTFQKSSDILLREIKSCSELLVVNMDAGVSASSASGISTGSFNAFIPRSLIRPIQSPALTSSAAPFKSRFLPKHQKPESDRSSASPDRSISSARPGNSFNLGNVQQRSFCIFRRRLWRLVGSCGSQFLFPMIRFKLGQIDLKNRIIRSSIHFQFYWWAYFKE